MDEDKETEVSLQSEVLSDPSALSGKFGLFAFSSVH
jgi:hypothetical protein